MIWPLAFAAIVTVLGLPSLAHANPADGFAPPAWAGIPFVLLLLGIALLPLFAGHLWHSNRNKAVFAAGLALPVILFLLAGTPAHSSESDAAAGPGMRALVHSLTEYASFIVLLGALYAVAGGIALKGDAHATPLHNVGLLAVGALLANVIGTTGASMLLIRPLLQINRKRQHVRHLPVFFIFVVSNLGGLLTPLGDPPLFLGFLNGVDFLWTFTLWPQWLVANSLVLAVALVWDVLAYRREPDVARAHDHALLEPLRLCGLVNLIFLGGIIAAAVLQSEHISTLMRLPHLSQFAGVVMMATMAAGSMLATPRGVRAANGFSWGALVEVAILFAGIFVTMVPALAYLGHHRAELGVSEAWEYFWLAGALSSFLDNAPTYMTFAALAAGGNDLAPLSQQQPLLLQAISCGAVFMGANTYIGNGPNFMVKAIAEEMGCPMPSFFGYMAYAAAVLLPIFILVTLIFFAPGS
jgi:Na+/H+ antiporter NhaD/arsenite permease-like protein